jgi:hypothetical protein
VLSALARDRATVGDPSILSVDHLLEEFANKQSLLENADNDYVSLGDTPERGTEAADGGRARDRQSPEAHPEHDDRSDTPSTTER